MDSLIAAAARALSTGDPFSALKRVALRDDPAALALRGIAMAQLGDYKRARKLLRDAARGFGPRDRLAKTRCQVASAEVALVARDLKGIAQTLDTAIRTLEARGDRVNAVHARLIRARQQLLLGELDAAEQTLANLSLNPDTPPALAARVELTYAELALRRVRAAAAATAFERARAAAARAGIPALMAEIEQARRGLLEPSARLIKNGVRQPVRLDEIEALFDSGQLIVDACRRVVHSHGHLLALAKRPVLFALLCALAEAWPADVARVELIQRAFRVRRANESHRARLRVELSRLRTVLRPFARIEASARGFALVPANAPGVVVLAPPIDGAAGAILALLDGGESWSTSSLARALGVSQRTIQRALRELEASAALRAVGHGRARRWVAPPLSGFATNMLLPGAMPIA